MNPTSWTLDDLWRELDKFRGELVAAQLRPNSIKTYVGRASIFLRWLADDYRPRGPR